MTIAALPSEIRREIAFLCGFTGLVGLQRVSKEYNQIGSDDQIWSKLFSLNFKEEIPQKSNCKEAFRKRLSPVCLTNTNEIDLAITSFFCELKWNTKRQFVCLFPKEPSYFLNVQQSFGPQRGTEEGSKGLADEVVYYRYWGDISPRLPADQSMQFDKTTKCPEDSSESGIPLSLTRNWSTARHPNEKWPYLQVGENFVNGSVHDVDVGFGNTLGYFSGVNSWAFPFKLHCISGNLGKPIWVGNFPICREFKMVKISSDGEVVWEKGIDKNRNLFPHPRYDATGCQALRSNFSSNPVVFHG